MEYVIEHPHQNATKTLRANPIKDSEGKAAYRIEILHESYSGSRNMFSNSKLFDSILYEEELDELITALQRIKMAKLLGLK
ncbi:MAG: hypothetical protein [Bacteriophage sp.]|nr:MAG: hypothetical protein [Bacteriophage sp.]